MTTNSVGRIIDLSDPDLRFPERVVVDSNVTAARFLASYRQQDPRGPARAARVFRLLRTSGTVGVVTPTVLTEVFHVVVRAIYQQELAAHRSALTAHYGEKRRYSWLELYKINPSIVKDRADDLERLRQTMVANNLFFVEPDALGPIRSGFPYDREILRLIGRYGLDTGDVSILLEAQRIGISAIVSFDHDMRRAHPDFDVYSWP